MRKQVLFVLTRVFHALATGEAVLVSGGRLGAVLDAVRSELTPKEATQLILACALHARGLAIPDAIGALAERVGAKLSPEQLMVHLPCQQKSTMLSASIL